MVSWVMGVTGMVGMKMEGDERQIRGIAPGLESRHTACVGWLAEVEPRAICSLPRTRCSASFLVVSPGVPVRLGTWWAWYT